MSLKSTRSRNKAKFKRNWKISAIKTIAILFILIFIGSIGFASAVLKERLTKSDIYKTSNQAGDLIAGSSTNNPREAIFMTNGQVYFANIEDNGGQYLVVKDVYYLKADDLKLPSDDTESKKIDLVKMGNELHQPQDLMYINRDHVLFYQPLSDLSKINEAVKNFVEKQTSVIKLEEVDSQNNMLTTQ